MTIEAVTDNVPCPTCGGSNSTWGCTCEPRWPSTVPVTNYQALYEAACDELATLRALSVTNIMLDVVPGFNGMGHEIYATCVDDVVNALSKQCEQTELLTDIENWLVCACIATPDDMAQSFEPFRSQIAKLLRGEE